MISTDPNARAIEAATATTETPPAPVEDPAPAAPIPEPRGGRDMELGGLLDEFDRYAKNSYVANIKLSIEEMRDFLKLPYPSYLFH